MPSQPPSLTLSRARLYGRVRSAHLERAREFAPAAIVYGERRYDFDESLAEGLELVQAGPVSAARLVARSSVRALEVNEPLMLHAVRRTALTLAALRVQQLLTGRRVTIVSYAIENRDPWISARNPRALAGRILDHLCASYVWRRIDRMAFGTQAAQNLYHELFPPVPRDEVLIVALPAARSSAPAKDPERVAFVGAFSVRKGFDLLLQAWPLVTAVRPAARLAIIGKGQLDADARLAEANDDSIDLTIDPPRSDLLRRLDSARVLVLPSQPTPRWKEQVGLPIVEGLAAGCSVVTTTETGLAAWLGAHGHATIPPRSTAQELADAILAQLAGRRAASDVIADLPTVDGRRAADDWLFASELGDAASSVRATTRATA